jgi:hypothetical protein
MKNTSNSFYGVPASWRFPLSPNPGKAAVGLCGTRFFAVGFGDASKYVRQKELRQMPPSLTRPAVGKKLPLPNLGLPASYAGGRKNSEKNLGKNLRKRKSVLLLHPQSATRFIEILGFTGGTRASSDDVGGKTLRTSAKRKRLKFFHRKVWKFRKSPYFCTRFETQAKRVRLTSS